jgi:hypothetical protein
MLLNIPIVNTSQAIERAMKLALVRNMGHDKGFYGMPTLFLGEAGCGKSYAFMAAAKRLANEVFIDEGCQFVEVPAMSLSPSDAAGSKALPTGDQDPDYVYQLFPDYVRGLDKDRPAIIVYDEGTKPPLATRNALLQIFHSRRAGRFELGRHWHLGMTGNVATAKAGDTDNPSPFRSRVAQYMVRNTCQQFLDNYAIPANLHYSITSFIRTHAADEQFEKYHAGPLNTWDPAENPAAYACERAYENLSNVADSGIDPRDFAAAIVGNEVGNLYCTHLDMLDEITDIDLIRTQPKTAPVPDDIMVCHYVGSMIAYWADRQSMDAIATYLRRMPNECAVVSMTEVVNRHPECKETKAYIDFRLEYKLSL